jgi:hypothetical protein
MSIAKWTIGMSFTLTIAACGGSSGSSGGTTPTGGGDLGTLTVRNTSHFAIHSIQLAPWDDPSWGRNLLGDDPLLVGETGTIPVFDCAKYDLRLVDDLNAECIIEDIDLCLRDQDWTFDESVLADCNSAWTR